jgi:lipid-A-disaccharide synthase
MPSKDLLIVAGEASGDLHGGRLLARLREADPELRPFGLGGDELQAAGLEALAHSAEISVMGISEALAVLPRARRIFRHLLDEVDRRQPKVAVLVDFAEFNLRLAAELHRRGVLVAYYVSPQVWAWRVGRVRRIARDVARMLVLLPFEESFYAEHGVEAVHVGHPLVDEVPVLPQVWDREPEPAGGRVVSLLPGSRRSEIDRLLPVMLAAADQIRRQMLVRFRLIKAPSVPRELLEAHLAGATVEIEIVESERLQALADSHLTLCASGTATLEVGLLGTPMVIVYRVSFWSYLAGLLMVRLPWVSLVNLVLRRRAVPELLQRDATPQKIAETAVGLLGDPDRVQTMRSALSELRGLLGPSGASLTAASEVLALLRR